MKLIVPVAGDSSRFPDLKPKWLLTHPNGNLMFHEAISGLDLSQVDEIILVCRRDHFIAYDLGGVIETQFECSDIRTPHRVVVIDPTRSQPETVARALEAANVTGPIFIKDSDNRFSAAVSPGNYVCTLNLNQVGFTDAANKSYVEVDERNDIVNIVEKHVISNVFCVGGYAFESAETYLDYFRRLQNDGGLYVSHVIYRMLLDGALFKNHPVQDFADWGTARDWERFKSQFATVFVDLDGTLVESSSQFFERKWGETDGLPGNVKAINALHGSGKVRVVLTTSRKKAFAAATARQLERLGVQYHDILYELPHAKRILINDYSRSNRYKVAEAINIPRDSDDLDGMLRAMFDCLQ